jgi:hypothetical protein
MANTIYERLALNFDTTKFGNVSILGQATIDYYRLSSLGIKDWQYDDIVNSTAGRGEYFQNPLSGVCDNLKIVVDNMIESSNTTLFENNPSTGNLIYSTAVSSSPEIVAFKSHTDNISGTYTETMSANIPNYDMAVTYGNEVLKMVISFDEGMNAETANASTFLGSLTSLFIGDDLDDYLTILTTDAATVNNSIYYQTVEDPEDANLTINIKYSNLSSVVVSGIYDNVNSFYTLINTRRLEDWAYFTRLKDTMFDYYSVKRFDSIGNTQISLINQYIGTEKLKNIIANT